jgi:hypothetical protein
MECDIKRYIIKLERTAPTAVTINLRLKIITVVDLRLNQIKSNKATKLVITVVIAAP